MSKNQIKLEEKKGITIFRPEQEIVFENSNAFKEKTKKIIKKEGIEKIIIDLKSVPYLDSSGVGFIISLLKFMRQKEGKMVITNLNEKVKRVCELTKLDEVIDVYESIDRAVADLS